MSFFSDDVPTSPLGKGTISGFGALQNPRLSSLLANYHRTVAHNYKPIAPSDVGQRLPSGTLMVSPKIDGQLWYLMFDGDDPVLVSPRRRVIRGDIPLLNEYRDSRTARGEEDTPDVFISFSSKDMERAKRMKEILAEAGVSSWFSPENMKSLGENFVGQLQDRIEKCHAVLALLSEGYIESQFCEFEIGAAYEARKKTFALWLDGSSLRAGTSTKFILGHQQQENGAGELFEDAARDLAEQISEHLRPKETLIAGELFVEKTGNDRPRVADLTAMLDDGKQADVESLSFCAFDLVEGGDNEAKKEDNIDYPARMGVLQRRLEGGKRCRAVVTEKVTSREEVSSLYADWVSGGTAEVIVVRADDDRIFKIKPSHEIDAAVIGYTEGSGEEAGTARSLLLAVMREDESFQEICGCGNLGDLESRRELFGMLDPLKAPSSYRRASDKRVMYQFVRPEKVVEINLLDVQSEDASNERVRRMVLEYGEDGWQAVRPMPGVAIHNPGLVRVRTDKEVNKVDVRADQFDASCSVAEMGEAAEGMKPPASSILRREVWTKTAKGVMAVQKLLVWKTNKDSLDALYPACVVHWTNYSPTRKDPLKRTVRLAPTEEVAQASAEELVEKNIKKGWEPVETTEPAAEKEPSAKKKPAKKKVGGSD